MAVLAGGRPLLRAAGHTLAGVTLHDLGAARRVWADTAQFGIVGGKGDPRRLRAHIANLRTLFARTTDAAARASIQARIGKLLGGSATLSIGATTETECAALTQIAERAARALRGARMEGVVPGGGVAFLECRPVLQEMLDRSTDLDEQAAYRLLIRALEEPMRTIIGNAGCDAGEIMGQVRLAGPGSGYDVRIGQVVHMAPAGIFDVASVQKAAIRRAITTAAIALSVDVLVHHRKPERLTVAG
jgi:chaperonin GroEL